MICWKYRQASRRRGAFKIDERIPPLNADEVRLRQILINLLSNAIKFTSRGGTVTISAGQVGYRLRNPRGGHRHRHQRQ